MDPSGLKHDIAKLSSSQLETMLEEVLVRVREIAELAICQLATPEGSQHMEGIVRLLNDPLGHSVDSEPDGVKKALFLLAVLGAGYMDVLCLQLEKQRRAESN